MEKLLQQSEVNLRTLINSKADKSVEVIIQETKTSQSSDNQILADELFRQDSLTTSFFTALKEQLSQLEDDVKKGEKVERISDQIDSLSLSLEEVRNSVGVQVNRVKALGLRVAQIEETLKADKVEKKKAAEIRSEKLMKRIAAAEEAEAAKVDLKGKGKVGEAEIKSFEKAAGKRPLEKSAKELKIEADKIWEDLLWSERGEEEDQGC